MASRLAQAAICGTAAISILLGWPLTAGAASDYTDRQGVDACDYPSSNDLSALYAGTPFWDFGYYLGGAEASAAGCAPWTSATRTAARNIGWGFTPIWDDLQAPSGCGPVINGTRHDFAARMSINTTTAYNEGVSSANAALSAMSGAGFGSADTVWLDIEGYDRTQQACRNAVNAYVNGWSAAAGVDAGVYGSASGSGVSDWAHISHPPFAVWIANPGINLNTVWNDPYVSNSYWVYDQRMHQYRTSQHKVPVSMPNGYDVDCLNTWADQGSNFDDETNEASEASSLTGDATCYGATQ